MEHVVARKSTLGNNLLGIPMIWWGRFGKIAALAIAATIVGGGVGWGIWFVLAMLIHWVADGLRHPTAAPLRLVAVVVLLIGFHVDLLAS